MKITSMGYEVDSITSCGFYFGEDYDLSNASKIEFGIVNTLKTIDTLLTGLEYNKSYYVKAYAVNKIGTIETEVKSFTSGIVLPTISTDTIINITGGSATCNATISNNGGMEVTERGICWATHSKPTTNDEITNNGTGTGSYSGDLTNLQPATAYYVRAYATTSVGTAYGEELSFSSEVILPEVTLNEPTNVLAQSVSLSGTIKFNGGATITDKGFCWATSQNPDLNDNTTSLGSSETGFEKTVDGLSLNTTYYVRAYATNSKGSSYSNQQSFTTLSGLIVLTTEAVTEVTATTAKSGGNVTDDGGAAITAKGVCWSTSSNPTIADNKTVDGSGTGAWVSELAELSVNTTYYIRAYATNSVGTVYGNEQSFTTADGLPTGVTTTAITAITATTATSGGNVSDDGGFAITAKGVCWSTSSNPTTADNKTVDGSGTGAWVSELVELNVNTTYYVRAYATNSVGTVYGDEIGFTTLSETDVYNPSTGKIWMDRNLGATQVATSSTDADAYGDLYQWGRGADGHEKRNSGTTSTLSSSNTPGHGNFITNGSSSYDWRSPQNDNLWQGTNGTNNPCPSGYRLPTEAEWDAERASWSSNNSNGAFASPLKLPVAGYRSNHNGLLYNVGSTGVYWSSTVDGTLASYLGFYSSNAYMRSFLRADGYSVRCLKD
jgi:uncharacterized protein (TIGR02145 family)